MGETTMLQSSDPNSGKRLNRNSLLIINLPVLKVLRVASRSLFLTFILLAWPSIGFFSNILISSSNSTATEYLTEKISGYKNLELLPLVFESVAMEGLIKRENNHILILASGFGGYEGDTSVLSNNNDIDLVMDSDIEYQSSIHDEFFDFAFASSFTTNKFVDRVMKNGGIVVFQLGNDAVDPLEEMGNYKIVFVQQLNCVPLVAVKKIGARQKVVIHRRRKRFCGNSSNAKKEALEVLEDPLLEPPRWDSSSFGKHLYKANFLSYLMGNFISGCPRMVFLNVVSPEGDSGNGIGWFLHNYPRRGYNFELYDLKAAAGLVGFGVSDWLSENVKDDDFVVVKAEAGVVEEMLERKSICLVDELFLECEREMKKNQRAYWECLAIYGRLKDEGIAVHQWWG